MTIEHYDNSKYQAQDEQTFVESQRKAKETRRSGDDKPRDVSFLWQLHLYAESDNDKSSKGNCISQSCKRTWTEIGDCDFCKCVAHRPTQNRN